MTVRFLSLSPLPRYPLRSLPLRLFFCLHYWFPRHFVSARRCFLLAWSVLRLSSISFFCSGTTFSLVFRSSLKSEQVSLGWMCPSTSVRKRSSRECATGDQWRRCEICGICDRSVSLWLAWGESILGESSELQGWDLKRKKNFKIARKKSNAFTLNRRGEGNIGPKKDPLSYAKSILSRILVLQDNTIALGRNF